MEGERGATVRLKTGAWFMPAMVDSRPAAKPSPAKARPAVRLRPWGEDDCPPLNAMAAA